MPVQSYDRTFFAGKRPRIMAHRGASGEAPENTIPAFDLAVEQAADILEMDVHLTRDGYVVVAHDPTVDRVTDGHGAIADMTLAQLQALDAGYRFTADGGTTYPFRGTGVQVPTLAQVLARYPQMPLNIEIKAHSEVLVRKTRALLEEHGRLGDKSVVLAAFDHGLIEIIRRIAPEVETCFSVKEIRQFLVRTWLNVPRFRSIGRAFQVPVRRSLLRIVTARFVRVAQAAGFEVHPWTIDDEAEMHRLLDLGVDGLFTNHPALARQVLAARGM